ncbi:MAG: TolC family protein [Cyclobacteriaceae bacterium]
MKKPVITGLILLVLVLCSSAQQKKVLTLQECIEIAVENNLSVQRSQLNLETSRVNFEQSKGQRYPTLNVNGNYGFNWGRGIDPTTNQFTTQRINFNGLGANSSMPLIQGLQTTNSIRQSKLDVESSELDVQKAINDISLSISLTYLNVIFNKELLENARFQLESGEQQLDRTKKLVESGALPVSNELQLISQVATNEVNLITAENNLDLALLSLKQALLLPTGEDIDIVIPEIEIDQAVIEESSIEDIYKSAIASQPEIESADKRVESANLGLAVSRGGMLPTLNLNGSVNTNYSDAAKDRELLGFEFNGETNQTFFQTETGIDIVERGVDFEFSEKTTPISTQYDENFRKSLSVGLFIPIFNGFNARSSVQRSKIAVQQAEISSVEQRNILYQSIESAYRNAVAAAKTFSASQKQVAALEETFRSIENQYNLGSSNFTDYQVASNNLFQARSDLSRAKYDFIFKQKVLDFYEGKPLSF